MTNGSLYKLETILSQERMAQQDAGLPSATTNGGQVAKGEKQAGKDAQPTASGDLLVSWPAKPALVHGAPFIVDPQTPATLPALLRKSAAEVQGEQIIYVQADGAEYAQSYAELLSTAEQILAGLRQHGLQPQAKVILQLRHNQDILPAFWGCLLGGFIPVMTAVPPTYREANNDLERLKQVWQQLSAPPPTDGVQPVSAQLALQQPLILTDEATQAAMADLTRWLPVAAEQIVTVAQLRDHAPDIQHYPAQPDEVAFFSLTSGSTGAPKLIQLTHRNLLVRAQAANQYCGHTRATITLNWLPLEHIGPISDLHLRAVMLGCKQIYVTRTYVVGNPLNWLRLLDRYRATYSASPNFGYALINSDLEQLEGKFQGKPQESWELSCVETLLCAGEAVSPQVMQTFLTKLAAYGLKSTAVQPAFGMAEIGSGITYYRATSESPIKAFWVERASLAGRVVQAPSNGPNSVGLTSLGSIIPGLSMRIVDQANQVLPEGVVGRFQVKGIAVSPGYYQNPVANQEVFLADGWFDTGDLGMIIEGELILTGRAKESIIVNGANFANTEIEAAAERVAGVDRSYTVACAVRMPGRDREQLALFFVPSESAQDELIALIAQIRQAVVQGVGIVPDYFAPLTRTEIPKTAIGKLQRVKLAKRLENGDFDHLLVQQEAVNLTTQSQSQSLAEPRNELERCLLTLWQEALQAPQLGIHDDFFALGGTSINAARLIARLQEELKDTFHVVALFNAPTVEQLAAYLQEHYPETVSRRFGAGKATDDQAVRQPLTLAELNEVRKRLPIAPPLRHRPGQAPAKNPSAVFVLSAARSGSTLLRVMLAGHPQLFAPPELVLLGYETLAEREVALTGDRAIWREGVLKAVTQLYGWSNEQADAWVRQLATEGKSVQEFYGLLQQALGTRLLVEKSPQYTLSLETLRRIENYFEQPRFIYLTRHPYAALQSFEEARLDQVLENFMPNLQPGAEARKFSPAELGEATWLISQENILAFLQEIPAERQFHVQYETLVKQPHQQMKAICTFLGLDFHEGMVQPYQEKAQRMTTGLHEHARMLGDVKFHQHKHIDASLADRWRTQATAYQLSDVTWQMAERLGYSRDAVSKPVSSTATREPEYTPQWISRSRPSAQARLRLFCFHYAGGSAALFQRWPNYLPPDIEVCALQLPGRANRLRETPFRNLAPLTAALVEVLKPALDRPYALFGYSIGGLIAFEVARRLRKQDLPPPCHLLVAARSAPQFPQPQPHIAQLPDDEFIRILQAAGNAIPQELATDQELLRLMLPTLRADFQLAERYIYHPTAPLACPITVFGGTDDARANPEQLAGWRQHTTLTFQQEAFVGGHLFLYDHEASLVQKIAAILREN